MCMGSSHCCTVDIESLRTDTWNSLAYMQNSPFLELIGSAVYLGKACSDYAFLLQIYSPPLPLPLQHALGISLFLCLPYFLGIYMLIFPHLIMNS